MLTPPTIVHERDNLMLLYCSHADQCSPSTGDRLGRVGYWLIGANRREHLGNRYTAALSVYRAA